MSEAPASEALSRWGRSPSGEPLDLSTCAREPIHIPGSIQPHGALLAVTEPELRIVQVSANSEALLGLPPAKLLELTLHALLDEVSLARVRSACEHQGSRLEDQSPLRVATTSATRRLSRAGLRRDLASLERSLDRSTSVVDLCARAAIEVRGLTGFDRVMVYRFDADWHGEVIAEAKRGA